ncbi:MAG: protein translocase subunit secA, partial [Candidatus Berkelbacteria bacterium Gr01-1014_85]
KGNQQNFSDVHAHFKRHVSCPYKISGKEKWVDQAQKRVEGNNFDIRKHLVEYDDVMNRHRSLIYAERQRILALRPTEDDWLHRRIIETLAADERRIIDVKVERYGLPLWREVEQAIFLRVIDSFWLEHLNSMQQLRDGIGLQAYGQHDPLVEYKHQAYELFQTLRQRIETQAINVVLRAEPQLADGTVPSAQGPDLSQAKAKPNRNDPCFCGSGQKYKKCHGK